MVITQIQSAPFSRAQMKHHPSPNFPLLQEFERRFCHFRSVNNQACLPHVLVCGVVIYGEDYTKVPPPSPSQYSCVIAEWTEDFFWSEHFSRRHSIRSFFNLNKTRTFKNGAISKAQKAQNNFLEKNLKFLKKIFLSKKVA